jgi:hypothetical protein
MMSKASIFIFFGLLTRRPCILENEKKKKKIFSGKKKFLRPILRKMYRMNGFYKTSKALMYHDRNVWIETWLSIFGLELFSALVLQDALINL